MGMVACSDSTLNVEKLFSLLYVSQRECLDVWLGEETQSLAIV